MMSTKGNLKVKVKKLHGMKHKGIDQEVKWGISGEEVDLVWYHMGEDNIGTNLKVENHGKPMSIKIWSRIERKTW